MMIAALVPVPATAIVIAEAVAVNTKDISSTYTLYFVFNMIY